MVKKSWICLILVLVASRRSVIGKKISDYVQTCHRSDPKVTHCIKQSIESLRPRLIKGIPELNIPALDPFRRDKVVIFDGKDRPGFNAYLTDVVARGIGKFQVPQIKLDIDKKIYKYEVKIPSLDVTGNYDIDIKLFGFPIKSAGKYHSNSTSLHGQAILQAVLGDHNQLIFKTMSIKAEVGDFDLYLENGFDENPVVDQAIKEVFHNNKKDVIKLLAPFTEKVLIDMLLPLCNDIVKDWDYEEIFPF